MKGRPSHAALQFSQWTGTRPEAPPELNSEHRQVWKGIVDAMPLDWFGPETFPLLVQYCRHKVRADWIARVLEQMEGEGVPDPRIYAKMLIQERFQSQIIGNLASKMRLAQLSTYAQVTKKAKTTTKLWEDVGLEGVPALRDDDDEGRAQHSLD